MRSNCILFALALYLRRAEPRRIAIEDQRYFVTWRSAEPRRITVEGQRYFFAWRSVDGRCILIRTSRLGSLLPHVLYAERRPYGLRIVHFVPVNAKVKKVPPPFFNGRLRWGDPP